MKPSLFSRFYQEGANRTEQSCAVCFIIAKASKKPQVIKLQDPEYKARYARENQMYTKDGETILIIIDKDGKRMIEANEE